MYVLSFFKNGDTIQGGHYIRGDIISGNTVGQVISKSLKILSLHPRISKVLLDNQPNYFSQ